jgi:hypothetical protein
MIPTSVLSDEAWLRGVEPGVTLSRRPPEFSLVLGGPLFKLWRRLGLADDALGLMNRRIVVMATLCWLPLFLLAAFEGVLLGGIVAVPFLLDVEVHAKFLLAVPLLLAAESNVNARMRNVASQFLDRQLIPPDGVARFDAALASVARLRDSRLAEALLVALVYGVGILVIWRQYIALDASTWYAAPAADGAKLSWAGTWYGYVSLPIFQFLLLRWYYRIFVWARFLWQVSRIDLRLIPTHPDRTGGLGLLACAIVAFLPLAAAHGVLLSGNLADRIFFLGATLTSFKLEIAALTVFVLCLVLVPLTAFSHQLWLARLAGGREYGTLAQRYVREFDEKWLRGGAPPGEPFLGSPDLQSLADLDSSLEIVKEMRSTPFGKDAIFTLAIATLAPIVPLVLTMMPLEELVRKLLGILV